MNVTQTKTVTTSTRQPRPLERAVLDFIMRHPALHRWGAEEWKIYLGLGGAS